MDKGECQAELQSYYEDTTFWNNNE
jgi:hypothetical protein